MKFGEKFASVTMYTGEVERSIGLGPVKQVALREFRYAAEKDPEVIVIFEHTIDQRVGYRDFMRDRGTLMTEAIVLRAQLAIEGPR